MTDQIPRTLARADFDALLGGLHDLGFEVIGPRASAGAIVLDRVERAEDLPIGLADDQSPGGYRLRERGDGALFGFSSGPSSWKRFLHPPVLRIWSARRERGSGALEVEMEPEQAPPLAFLGVRSCDLHAIASLDSALLEIEHPDPGYQARREAAFVVAVNCGQAGGTCFCASMGTGPEVERGFDLALTELLDDGPHRFLCEAGSKRGAELLAALPTAPATDADRATAAGIVAATTASMGRELEVDGLAELLADNLEHPQWERTAERCLSCGNCTSVCPTCFCTDVEDTIDLEGTHAERTRRWDSCFELDFSFMHGGSARSTVSSRYRQWMTHKLSSWSQQFDSAGCVGCGRCITWCPVGIDITEEAAAIRAADGVLA